MHLHYSQRPKAVQAKADEFFNAMSVLPLAKWYSKGEEYRICRVSDIKLIEHIVQHSTDRSEYYFLDVGAGGYAWVNNVAKFLCKNQGKPTGQNKYHIIGLEAQGQDTITKVGDCIVYKLGNFKIENMLDSFQERNLNFDGKIDLIVSKKTLQYLADPLGTFLQMFQLARTGSFLLVESLVFGMHNPSGQLFYDQSQNGLSLTAEHFLRYNLKSSYLMCPESSSITRNMLVQKSSDVAQVASLNYLDLIKWCSDDVACTISKYGTRFTSDSEDRLPSYDGLYSYSGNRSIFDLLKRQEALRQPDSSFENVPYEEEKISHILYESTKNFFAKIYEYMAGEGTESPTEL